MGVWDLPPALLLPLFVDNAASLAAPLANVSRATITTGAAYATSCAQASISYYSASSSWVSEHLTVSNQTEVFGGTSVDYVTYYENATTLCDGHPRLTASPAVSLSTGHITIPGPVTATSTYQISGYSGEYSAPSPSCSIAPSDCDGLWEAYTTSVNNWQSKSTGDPQITSPSQTPPCMNVSAASSYSSFQSSFRGCGLCTIFGQGVELVYFPVPTTVSRDMCATTPSGSLTHYRPGAVITAFTGRGYGASDPAPLGVETVVYDNNTFTSGTAYISISSVWAEDRCSKTIGSPVTNVLLAMPSQSVLSLRYSQDHFQYFMEMNTQTGWPVSYADFNTPIPFSAWIGQEMCEGPGDTWNCGVIYENNYRPQLAIPPEIRDLNPAWSGCQLWYAGLYDPPHALVQQSSAAALTTPTPDGYGWAHTSARPTQAQGAPASVPTTWQDLYGGGGGGSYVRAANTAHGNAYPSTATWDAITPGWSGPSAPVKTVVVTTVVSRHQNNGGSFGSHNDAASAGGGSGASDHSNDSGTSSGGASSNAYRATLGNSATVDLGESLGSSAAAGSPTDPNDSFFGSTMEVIVVTAGKTYTTYTRVTASASQSQQTSQVHDGSASTSAAAVSVISTSATVTASNDVRSMHHVASSIAYLFCSLASAALLLVVR